MPQELPTSIRLSRQLRRDLAAAAQENKRSLSAQIVYILTRWLDWRKGQRK